MALRRSSSQRLKWFCKDCPESLHFCTTFSLPARTNRRILNDFSSYSGDVEKSVFLYKMRSAHLYFWASCTSYTLLITAIGSLTRSSFAQLQTIFRSERRWSALVSMNAAPLRQFIFLMSTTCAPWRIYETRSQVQMGSKAAVSFRSAKIRNTFRTC